MARFGRTICQASTPRASNSVPPMYLKAMRMANTFPFWCGENRAICCFMRRRLPAPPTILPLQDMSAKRTVFLMPKDKCLAGGCRLDRKARPYLHLQDRSKTSGSSTRTPTASGSEPVARTRTGTWVGTSKRNV